MIVVIKDDNVLAPTIKILNVCLLRVICYFHPLGSCFTLKCFLRIFIVGQMGFTSGILFSLEVDKDK